MSSIATGKWFGLALTGQFSATAARRVDWVGDTVKVSLHTGALPNQDTADFFDDMVNEVSGGAYVQKTLANKAILAYDTATNETRLDADDVAWTAASFSSTYAVIYKDTGVAGTSPVLGYVDFGGTETVTAGTFTIQWDVTGVLKLAAA